MPRRICFWAQETTTVAKPKAQHRRVQIVSILSTLAPKGILEAYPTKNSTLKPQGGGKLPNKGNLLIKLCSKSNRKNTRNKGNKKSNKNLCIR